MKTKWKKGESKKRRVRAQTTWVETIIEAHTNGEWKTGIFSLGNLCVLFFLGWIEATVSLRTNHDAGAIFHACHDGSPVISHCPDGEHHYFRLSIRDPIVNKLPNHFCLHKLKVIVCKVPLRQPANRFACTRFSSCLVWLDQLDANNGENASDSTSANRIRNLFFQFPNQRNALVQWERGARTIVWNSFHVPCTDDSTIKLDLRLNAPGDEIEAFCLTIVSGVDGFILNASRH